MILAHRRSLILLTLLLLGLIFPAFAFTPPVSPPLREIAKIPSFRTVEEASGFLQKGIPTDKEIARIRQLLQNFGNDQFEIRDAAYEEMIRMGPIVLNPLMPGLESPEPEVQRQTLRIQRALKAAEYRNKQHAALDMLEKQSALKLEQIEPLFQMVEILGEERSLRDRLQECLLKVLPKTPGSDIRLQSFLKHRYIWVRQVGVEVLAKCFPAEIKLLEPLTADPSTEIRFHAYLELIRVGQKDKVVPFISLFENSPFEIALLIEDQLCRLYDGEKIPFVLTADTPEARQKSKAAWLDWWNKNGEKIPLTRLTSEPALRGLTLIGEVDGNPGNRVFEVDREGKKTWELRNCGGPVDVQALPNGNILIAEYYTSQVTERNRKGDIVWKSPPLGGNATSAQRLPNGNTLVSTHQGVMEFDRSGKRLGEFPNLPNQIYQVHRDKRGHTFVLGDSGLTELDPSNKILRTIPIAKMQGWGGFQVLPNQHFLIGYYNSANGYAEVDATGKALFEHKNINFEVTRLQKMRNGNVLVAGGNHNEVVEFDSNKKVVWKVATEGRPFAICRY